MEKFRQKIPYWVIDTISLVSGIITIITGIYGFYVLAFQKYIDRQEDNNYNINYNKILGIITIILFFLSIVLFIQMKKYGKLMHVARQVASKNYYNFLHDFRNQYFQMLKEHNLSKGEINTASTVEYLTTHTKEYLKKS